MSRWGLMVKVENNDQQYSCQRRPLQIFAVLPAVRRRLVALLSILLANVVRIRIVVVVFPIGFFFVVIFLVVVLFVVLVLVAVGVLGVRVVARRWPLARRASGGRRRSSGWAATVARLGLGVQIRFAAKRDGAGEQHFCGAFAACLKRNRLYQIHVVCSRY